MKKLLFLFLIVSLNSHCKPLNEKAETYFKSSEYTRMVMSPSGKYYLAETYYSAQEHIEIIDIIKKKSYVIFNGTNGVDISISNIQWVDNDSIIIQFSKLKSQSGFSLFKVIHLNLSSEILVKSTFEFEKNGYIIENLPKQSNKVLFAHILHGKKHTSGAYRVDLSDKESVISDFHFVNKIASHIRRPFYWLVDKNKKIRLIISKEAKSVHYWLLKNGHWDNVFTVDENSDDFIYPKAINSNNELIVIKRNKHKDKKGVYLFKATNLSQEKELFYSENFDVTSVDINPDNSNLIALGYTKNGTINEVIIDKKLKNAEQLLINKYPEFERIYSTSSLDFSKHLFLLHNFRTEGIFVEVDLEEQKTKKIIEMASWRKQLEKGRLEVLKFTNADGMVVESYLSLPEKKQVKALLVMPHGGPIGVRSYSYFDSLSHFLASYGIAVLKINYRGSSGFGKIFQDSGKKQWGTKIEKDINDVVSHAVKKFKLDETKICSAGISYGGYSALMLHINYPQRYKCIASIAGPTDLPLMFTSSDWNINKDSIKKMIEIVGDPNHDIERLKAQSPLYNAKKINAPVLLMHGTKDSRVNIEHSTRLAYVLNKLKKKVKFIKVQDAKHGFHLLRNQILQATELLELINNTLNLNLSFDGNSEIEA